jgi:hypothetical protein
LTGFFTLIFNWLQARPPLRLREKVWTETEFHGLLGKLGVQRLREVEVLLPTSRYFSTIDFSTSDDIQQLLKEVGQHLGMKTDHIEFHFESEGANFKPCVIEQKNTYIEIPSLLLEDAESMIALFIRELNRDYLIRNDWLQGDEINHHGVVDLCTVLVGGGVFSANTSLKERNRVDGSLEVWEMWKQAHSPARIFGYALALFSVIRDERKPLWSSYLTPDAQQAWKQGRRFLLKSSDCVFNIHNPTAPLAIGVTAVANRLRQAEPSIRLHALWTLMQYGDDAQQVLGSIEPLLDDPDSVVRNTAIDLIGHLGIASAAGKLRIVELIDDRDSEIAASAINAAASLRIPMYEKMEKDRSFADALLWLLQSDATPAMLVSIARAMMIYGVEAEFLAKPLLPALRNSLVRCESDTISMILQALNATVPDLRQYLEQAFESDPDLLAPIRADIDELGSAND